VDDEFYTADTDGSCALGCVHFSQNPGHEVFPGSVLSAESDHGGICGTFVQFTV
jgi:hypothetical protein